MATFDDETKKVILSQPHGTDGGFWQISIDHYYAGCIIVRKDEYWYDVSRLDKNKLELEDVQAIVDRITEFTGEGFKQVVYHVY